MADLDSQLVQSQAQLAQSQTKLNTTNKQNEILHNEINEFKLEIENLLLELKNLKISKNSNFIKNEKLLSKLSNQENEISSLKEHIERWEFVSYKMREEEIDRMSVLDKAISNYIEKAQNGPNFIFGLSNSNSNKNNFKNKNSKNENHKENDFTADNDENDINSTNLDYNDSNGKNYYTDHSIPQAKPRSMNSLVS